VFLIITFGLPLCTIPSILRHYSETSSSRFRGRQPGHTISNTAMLRLLFFQGQQQRQRRYGHVPTAAGLQGKHKNTQVRRMSSWRLGPIWPYMLHTCQRRYIYHLNLPSRRKLFGEPGRTGRSGSDVNPAESMVNFNGLWLAKNHCGNLDGSVEQDKRIFNNHRELPHSKEYSEDCIQCRSDKQTITRFVLHGLCSDVLHLHRFVNILETFRLAIN